MEIRRKTGKVALFEIEPSNIFEGPGNSVDTRTSFTGAAQFDE